MSSLVTQASLVNPQNAHFSNPGFSSKVGAVSGCGGSTSSDLALEQKGMYSMVKTGGKKRGKHGSKQRKSKMSRKMSRKNVYKGGDGYGFSTDQSLSKMSGVHGAHLAETKSYANTNIDSDTNMGAMSGNPLQNGGNNDLSYGTGGNPYYGFQPTDESLSTFAGAGYAPITTGLNSQCSSVPKTMDGGSRKRRSVSHKKKSSKKKSSKKKSTKKKSSKKKSTKKKSHRKGQKGGYSQYLSNIANTPGYSTGAPPALLANNSALASPPPITPTNTCMNSWKHLGDLPPYNEVF
jgi:phage repressor protein C with HTH and peptisase S24 domain